MNVTKSWKGIELDPDSVASPCGLISKSYFNGINNIYTIII
jgi:hypothetical protein